MLFIALSTQEGTLKKTLSQRYHVFNYINYYITLNTAGKQTCISPCHLKMGIFHHLKDIQYAQVYKRVLNCLRHVPIFGGKKPQTSYKIKEVI